MKLPKSIGLTDLGILTVLLVMVVLPPREMFAFSAHKGDGAAQFALALSEARIMAEPTNGDHVADFARRLGDANYKDWAVEIATEGAKAAAGSPTEWRALLAASVAYVDKLDVAHALDFATRALASCRTLPGGCPSWEEVRMTLYEEHLAAGVKSGIDPKRDPKGFRAAGENAVRAIRLNNRERENTPSPPPTP